MAGGGPQVPGKRGQGFCGICQQRQEGYRDGLQDSIQQRAAGGDGQQDQGNQEGHVQQSQARSTQGQDDIRQHEMGRKLPPKLTQNHLSLAITTPFYIHHFL